MWCPHCESANTNERRERSALGYRRFRVRPASGNSMSGPAQASIIYSIPPMLFVS